MLPPNTSPQLGDDNDQSSSFDQTNDIHLGGLSMMCPRLKDSGNTVGLGIDVGGTLIKLAWTDAEGQLVLHHMSTEMIEKNALWPWVKSQNIPLKGRFVRVTGGGAVRFIDQLQSGCQLLGALGVLRVDEMHAAVLGLNTILEAHEDTCRRRIERSTTSHPSSLSNNDPRFVSRFNLSSGRSEPVLSSVASTGGTLCKNDSVYPYLVVNIGSGVSMIKVISATSYERVTGTCLGGGTALGIAHVCSNVRTFDELLILSAKGTSWLDLTVGDLHGDAVEAAGVQDRLPSEAIAAAFGRLYLMGGLGDDTLSNLGTSEPLSMEDRGVITSTIINNNTSGCLSFEQDKPSELLGGAQHNTVLLKGHAATTTATTEFIYSPCGGTVGEGSTGLVQNGAGQESLSSDQEVVRMRNDLLRGVEPLAWEEDSFDEELEQDGDGQRYIESEQFRCDFSYSVVQMISYNLGYLAFLVSHIARCPRVFFTGKFVAAHPLTLKTLTYALDFCQTHYSMEAPMNVDAFFCDTYDGYIGAIGTLVAPSESARS